MDGLELGLDLVVLTTQLIRLFLKILRIQFQGIIHFFKFILKLDELIVVLLQHFTYYHENVLSVRILESRRGL